MASERHPTPTDPSDRILAIDALRGFALLGILVINIWFFAMPMAGGIYPPAWGDFSGLNYVAWFMSHVFFYEKFMALFTMLFGGGVLLFTESKERAGQPVVRLHLRRIGWLFLIGLAHAYLLWYGDILVSYAICGAFVVFARHWSTRSLLVAAMVLVAVPSLILVGSGGVLLLTGDDSSIAAFEEPVMVGIGADGDTIDAELAAYRGEWTDQQAHRVPTALELQTVQFVFGTVWRVTGMMLLGMALFKSGILSNDRSSRFYHRLIVAGGLLGFTLILAGVAYIEAHEWDLLRTFLFGVNFNYWGSIPLAIAYLGVIMAWCQGRPHHIATTSLAAVGRTAFSNYLLQTMLATTILYGHGLGLFGTLTRFELLGVVLLIWAIQIPLSVLWLTRYRYGPVEWLWRVLTYGERQPMKRA